MNVIIFNDYGYVQGGASQVALQSAKGLADAGHNVYFIYAVGPQDKLLIHPNIVTYSLAKKDLIASSGNLLGALSGIWDVSLENKVSKILNRFSAADTVIHVHAWVKALSISVVNAARKCGIPLVVTLHDYFSVCPNGGFYNYQQKKICHLKPMSKSCLFTNCDARKYSHKIWRVTRNSTYPFAGMPDRIKNFIYVSSFSKKILEEFLPKDANTWEIANPITIPSGQQASPEKNEYVTYVGRLSYEKGVVLFANSAKEAGVKNRFVGSGELDETLASINSESVFTGWVERTQVIELMKSSRALVLPSQWYETQGMVVAEAAALGIPSIVSDSCAGRDYVEDGWSGILFKSGDELSLRDALIKFSDSPQLAKWMGNNAYQKYWSNPPTIDAHIKQLESCYLNLKR